MKTLKRLLLSTGLILTLSSINKVNAQSSKGNFYLTGTTGAVLPLYDNNIPFGQKIVYGLEGNYFVSNGITVTGGLDYYTAGSNGWTAFVFGSRFYPGSKNFYLRHRAMVSTRSRFHNDFLVGVGNNFPLSDLVSAEVNADYHFVSNALGIKAGLAFTF